MALLLGKGGGEQPGGMNSVDAVSMCRPLAEALNPLIASYASSAEHFRTISAEGSCAGMVEEYSACMSCFVEVQEVLNQLPGMLEGLSAPDALRVTSDAFDRVCLLLFSRFPDIMVKYAGGIVNDHLSRVIFDLVNSLKSFLWLLTQEVEVMGDSNDALAYILGILPVSEGVRVSLEGALRTEAPIDLVDFELASNFVLDVRGEDRMNVLDLVSDKGIAGIIICFLKSGV